MQPVCCSSAEHSSIASELLLALSGKPSSQLTFTLAAQGAAKLVAVLKISENVKEILL